MKHSPTDHRPLARITVGSERYASAFRGVIRINKAVHWRNSTLSATRKRARDLAHPIAQAIRNAVRRSSEYRLSSSILHRTSSGA